MKEKMQIELSVIIPIYNTPQQFLKQCIESIQQNLKEMQESSIEVLLINDGSTEVYVSPTLHDVEAKDCRFRCIEKENSGVSETRNTGISIAQGEYLVFIDADDYLEPNALSYMLESIKREKVDMMMFGFMEDGKPCPFVPFKKSYFGFEKTEAIQTLIHNNMKYWYGHRCNLAAVWAKIYHREAIQKHQIRFQKDIDSNEDGYFNLCLLQAIDRFCVDNKIVYHYVVYEESAIHSYSNKDIKVALNMMPMLESFVETYYSNNKNFFHAMALRALLYIRILKERYFTHPKNRHSFWELKAELDDFLSKPIIKKSIKELRISDASNLNDLKNIILLKLHLYWIFLITERRKRKSNSNSI